MGTQRTDKIKEMINKINTIKRISVNDLDVILLSLKYYFDNKKEIKAEKLYKKLHNENI